MGTRGSNKQHTRGGDIPASAERDVAQIIARHSGSLADGRWMEWTGDWRVVRHKVIVAYFKYHSTALKGHFVLGAVGRGNLK